MPLRKAIFLDRDGTLNADAGYTHRREEWLWLDGALEGLRIFADAGYLLVVVSNQSGVGRGFYSLDDVKTLEKWLETQLKEQGLKISGWYYCPHGPNEGCNCRKPGPGLILRASRELDLDLANSWMLGDRLSDIQAGLSAGCRPGLVFNRRYPEEQAELVAKFPEIPIWKNLELAAQAIVTDYRDACGHMDIKDTIESFLNKPQI